MDPALSEGLVEDHSGGYRWDTVGPLTGNGGNVGYKVQTVVIKKLATAKNTDETLQDALDQGASQGWKLIQVTASPGGGMSSPRYEVFWETPD